VCLNIFLKIQIKLVWLERCSAATNFSINYEGCSESNASCFLMLAHDFRGRCWWYGSRGWTFPPISHSMPLLWTKWCLMWRCMWSKGVPLNSSLRKKWHPLTFVDACWMFMETKQWIRAQWGGGWCFSAVATATVVTFSGADFYEHGMQAHFIAGENAQLMMVTVFKNSVF